MVELVNLNEDITLDILLCCDVFSILRMEETCRYLRKVSLYRQLWLNLATNLDFDHAPNLLPHESLQSLSTERLREMVIRSTRSYLNWTRPKGPKPTRSISFEIPARSVRLAELLPGGKYFVYLDQDDCFNCYDTDSREPICTYTGASPRDEQIRGIDCLLVDEGNTLVLASVAMRLEHWQTSVTVLRFDIHSATSEIACTFTFAQDDEYRSIYDVVIGCEVVIVQEDKRILVCNWRTGEATAIVFERRPFIHLLFILHTHLCVVEETPEPSIGLSAIPLSAIFQDRSGHNSEKNNASAPYTSVRSQDVFRESTRVRILEGLSNAGNKFHIGSISVCTSSWKTPSMCEHDTPAIPTRILLLVRTRFDQFTVSELLFSPVSTNPLNQPSGSSSSDDASRNGCFLTHLRQSLALSYRRGDMTVDYPTSATQAGNLLAIYEIPTAHFNSGRYHYATAINMLNSLEDTSSNGATTYIRNELSMGRAALTSSMDHFIEGVSVDWNGIQIERYSGAIWYCSRSTLFIHHTD